MKKAIFVFFLPLVFSAFAKQVKNTNAAIANAQAGDFVIRKSGERVILNQSDIDSAKAILKEAADGQAVKTPIFAEHRTLFLAALIFAFLALLKFARKMSKRREKENLFKKMAQCAGKIFAKPAVFFQNVPRALGLFCLSYFCASLLMVFYYKSNPVGWIPLYSIRAKEFESAALPVVFKREWVEIEKMPQDLLRAVLAAEDDKFLFHAGFSLEGIRRAKELNRRNDGVLHGGSTISQQTAKNVFCTPSRTYFRKAVEAYFTVLIEIVWGKKRILEVYLNVIETGNGIYGVQAAAKEFFGKDVSKLTKKQAAQIAVTLPSPRRFASKSPSKYIVGRRDKISAYSNSIDLSPLALDADN